MLFNYSCVPFLPIPPPHPSWTPSLPHLYPHPWLCPCVLYSSSYNPLSSLSPSHSPLAIVRLFLTSMSLVIFCLLFSSVDYVPVKGEIIWYLSLTVQVMRTRLLQPRLLYPARLSIKTEGQIKSFPDKRSLKEYTSTKPALQEIISDMTNFKKSHVKSMSLKCLLRMPCA